MLGVLCNVLGPCVYDKCRDQILQGIHSNLERHGLADDAAFSEPTDGADEAPVSILSSSPNSASQIMEKRGFSERVSSSCKRTNMLHIPRMNIPFIE